MARSDRLGDMQAFVRVAELSSFTAAAFAMAVSVSAVTKAVRRIESELGVELLHRSTRQLHLTSAGSLYYERCVQLLSQFDAAQSAVRDANVRPSGTVRIAVPPAFGRRTLVPLLPRLFELYPEIVLDMHLKDQTSNPIDGGYDMAVHSGRLLDSRLVNRILIRGPQRTVGSPGYLERFGRPEHPADLLAHNCIVGRFGPNWRYGTEGGDEETVKVSGNLQTDSGDILRQAAIAGIGISQATWLLFGEDIRRGRLVSLLEPFEVQAEPIYLVFPAARNLSARVRLVADFLVQEMRTLVRDVSATPPPRDPR